MPRRDEARFSVVVFLAVEGVSEDSAEAPLLDSLLRIILFLGLRIGEIGCRSDGATDEEASDVDSTTIFFLGLRDGVVGNLPDIEDDDEVVVVLVLVVGRANSLGSLLVAIFVLGLLDGSLLLDGTLSLSLIIVFFCLLGEVVS